jgi:hypothetical protein
MERTGTSRSCPSRASQTFSRAADGRARSFTTTHRYAWPGEFDFMACIAGLILQERWSDWHRTPFTADRSSHVSVWEKTRT